MRNLSFAVLAFLFGSSAFAQNLTLVSETCDHASKLESTGFVLSWNKQVYVLASADFIYNNLHKEDQAKFCHQVIDAKGSSHSLELTRYDWGSGLALLKGDDSLTSFATPLTTVAPKILMKASWDTGSGQLVSVHSKRFFLPFIDEALELKATTDIHSQAVGSAISNASGEVIGIILDQYVEEVPGRSARVARWIDSQDKTSRQLTVLSSVTVSKWLEKVLQPNWSSPFDIDPQGQLEKKHRLTIGGVAFTEVCFPPGSDSGGGSSMPIGGGDPVGIGGGDPVGIGGGTSSDACRTDTSKALRPAALGSLDPLLSHRKEWISDLEGELDKNITHSIAWSYTGVLWGADYQPWAVVSIENFAQIMLRTEYGFVFARHDHNKPDTPAYP